MRRLGPLALVAVAPVALAGCLGVETTQHKSAAKARKAAGRIAHQKGLTIATTNRSVTVQEAVVVQDRNGVAAVVRLRNAGAAQIGVPLALTVADAKGTKLYANDTPGLDPSLVALPAIGRGEEGLWVNNQILVSGRAAKAAVRVGAAQATTGAALPRIEISHVTVGHDADGTFATGKVRNGSSVEQKRLTVFCVATRGRRVRAAGRAVIERLAPGPKPTRFTVFFIGDPQGAQIECLAPPTVVPGGSAR
jgi:hypothetical protein